MDGVQCKSVGDSEEQEHLDLFSKAACTYLYVPSCHMIMLYCLVLLHVPFNFIGKS